jgi:hypothetical protein
MSSVSGSTRCPADTYSGHLDLTFLGIVTARADADAEVRDRARPPRALCSGRMGISPPAVPNTPRRSQGVAARRIPTSRQGPALARLARTSGRAAFAWSRGSARGHAPSGTACNRPIGTPRITLRRPFVCRREAAAVLLPAAGRYSKPDLRDPGAARGRVRDPDAHVRPASHAPRAVTSPAQGVDYGASFPFQRFTPRDRAPEKCRGRGCLRPSVTVAHAYEAEAARGQDAQDRPAQHTTESWCPRFESGSRHRNLV